MVERHALHIREHSLEGCWRLAGEARHHGRAQRHVRHRRAQAFRRRQRGLHGRTARHRLENLRIRVLERHVHVLHGVRGGVQPVEEGVRDLARIGIEHAHPEVALDAVERAKKRHEVRAVAEIDAVEHRVLRDDVQFLHARLHERARLGEDALERTRPELPANRGNCAVRAAVRAPFRDLEVRERRAREAQRGNGRIEHLLRHPRRHSSIF